MLVNHGVAWDVTQPVRAAGVQHVAACLDLDPILPGLLHMPDNHMVAW